MTTGEHSRLNLNVAFFKQHLQGARQRLEKLEANANNAPTSSPALEMEAIYELSIALEELHVAIEEIQGHSEELLLARQSLALEHQRYQDLFDFAPDGYLVTTPEGVIQAANHACELLFNLSRERMVGKPLILFVADGEHSRFYDHLSQWGASSHLNNWEVTLNPRRGSSFPAAITVTAIHDLQGAWVGLRWSVRDISGLKQAQQMRHDAFHDSLTGLPNRMLLLDRLGHLLARYQRHPDQLFALLFLDLDRFKSINDSLGHLAGDQVLIEMAARLQTCVRREDTLARLGGDEFVILLEEIHDLSEAEACALRVQAALAVPFQLKLHGLVIQASIGIVLSHAQYQHPEALLRDADLAMYEAKRQGGARFQVFTTQMYTDSLDAFQLEQELHQAFQRGEFEVYYQPIVSLPNQTLKGFEALVRWHHPQRGLLSPSEFLPIAAESGLIAAIDQWVIRTACQQMVDWQTEAGIAPAMSIGVNVSEKLFSSPTFGTEVQSILQGTGLAPQCLVLEITEEVIMNNVAQAALTLSQLRGLQVQLLIDDFGIGYSSLSRLQNLSFLGLKIDRSFLQDTKSLEMLRAIIALAHTLGLYVVTEGVETVDQVQTLGEFGCEYAQGYYFGRPTERDLAQLKLRSAYESH